MSLKALVTGLALMPLVLVGGCHTTTSRCNQCPGQPVVASSPALVAVNPGCNACNAPPPAPVATTVVVPGNGH